MINVRSNISSVLQSLNSKFTEISSTDQMLRAVALTLHGAVKNRIHVEGLAADGRPIGQYSKAYMSVRTGKFESNDVYKSGPRKGQTKDSGKFTRGPRKGETRPQYNRGGDTKVILSLTRQLENDFSVQQTDNGYGLGFTNDLNVLKAQGLEEENYKKKIWALTEEEKDLAIEVSNRYLKGVLK